MLFSGIKGKVVKTPKDTLEDSVVVEFDFPRMLEKEAMDLTIGTPGEITKK